MNIPGAGRFGQHWRAVAFPLAIAGPPWGILKLLKLLRKKENSVFWKTKEEPWQSMASAPRNGTPIEIKTCAGSHAVVQWVPEMCTIVEKGGRTSQVPMRSCAWKHVGYTTYYVGDESMTEWRAYHGAMPSGPDQDPHERRYFVPSRR